MMDVIVTFHLQAQIKTVLEEELDQLGFNRHRNENTWKSQIRGNDIHVNLIPLLKKIAATFKDTIPSDSISVWYGSEEKNAIHFHQVL